LFLRQWDCAGMGSALLHRRMGGCEIPLTDPSVAPLAPNIPFVAITFRDHLRSGGRTADAEPPFANNVLRSRCAVPGGEAGSHSGGAGFDHLEAQVAAR
jgi:hypothetical protein